MVQASWRDHEDRPVERPGVPGSGEPAYWREIGDHQGAAYRRNAFARATEPEIDALWQRFGLVAGVRVLDVGCGVGRHLVAAGIRGATGAGVDVSPAFVAEARRAIGEAGLADRLDVIEHDARDLDAVLEPGAYDVAWSLSQGAVGTDPAGDADVVAGMAQAVRPGGLVIVTVFHALFAARHLTPGDAFDPVHLVHHQVAEVRGVDEGDRRPFDLWTTSYTVPGARRLLADAGLEPFEVSGASPGRYERQPVTLDDPELLIAARRPGH